MFGGLIRFDMYDVGLARWALTVLYRFWILIPLSIDGDTILVENEVYYCCDNRLNKWFCRIDYKQHETVRTVRHNQTISL